MYSRHYVLIIMIGHNLWVLQTLIYILLNIFMLRGITIKASTFFLNWFRNNIYYVLYIILPHQKVNYFLFL